MDNYWDIIKDNRPHVLSNIPSEQAEIAKQAAIETRHKITINPIATDMWGRVINHCVAIETLEKGNFNDFWNRFRELLGEVK